VVAPSFCDGQIADRGATPAVLLLAADFSDHEAGYTLVHLCHKAEPAVVERGRHHRSEHLLV